MISNKNGHVEWRGSIMEVCAETGVIIGEIIHQARQISPEAENLILEGLIGSMTIAMADFGNVEFKEPSNEELRIMRAMHREVIKPLRLIAKAMEEQQGK